MPIGFIFWLLAVVFYVVSYWEPYSNNPHRPRFNGIWVFVPLALLGLAVQGPGIR